MASVRLLLVAVVVVGLAVAVLALPQTRSSQRNQEQTELRERLEAIRQNQKSKNVSVALAASRTRTTTERSQEDKNRGYLTKFVPTREGCNGTLDLVTEEDIDNNIDDKELIEGYKKCLLAPRGSVRTTCTCTAWELLRIMSGLLTPNLCRPGYVLPYCPTDAQRKKGETFMKYLSRVDSQSWKEFVKVYGGKGSNLENIKVPGENSDSKNSGGAHRINSPH